MNEHTLTLFIKNNIKNTQVSLNKLIKICFLIDLNLKQKYNYKYFSKKYLIINGMPDMPIEAKNNNFKYFNIKNGLIFSIKNEYSKKDEFNKYIYDLLTHFYFIGIKDLNKLIVDYLNEIKILNNCIYLIKCKKKPFEKELADLLVVRNLTKYLEHSKRIRREIRYYYCEICNAYHLTSQPQYL